jgi:hypothetical protein
MQASASANNVIDQFKAFRDLIWLLEVNKLPRTDVSATVESRRKDIEALVEANKTACRGAQALIAEQKTLARMIRNLVLYRQI